MDEKDYYEILGVGRDASQRGIEQAYRWIALQYHPDLNPSGKMIEAKFKEINVAYQVFLDREKKEEI